MKPILIALSLTLTLSSAHAQLTKKNWLVGGNGSYYNYNEDFSATSVNYTVKARNIDISSTVGYFFVDRLTAGLRPYFSAFKSESSGGGKMNYYRLAIGPFARYYFLKGERRTNLLADVGYQFGVNKDFPTLTNKGKFNIFSTVGGIEIFFNSSAGVEILFGYVNKVSSLDDSPMQRSNKKGFQLSVGFQLHLETQ
jgi:hypothetical protein